MQTPNLLETSEERKKRQQEKVRRKSLAAGATAAGNDPATIDLINNEDIISPVTPARTATTEDDQIPVKPDATSSF